MENLHALAGSLSPKPALQFMRSKSLDVTNAIMSSSVTTRNKKDLTYY